MFGKDHGQLRVGGRKNFPGLTSYWTNTCIYNLFNTNKICNVLRRCCKDPSPFLFLKELKNVVMVPAIPEEESKGKQGLDENIYLEDLLPVQIVTEG